MGDAEVMGAEPQIRFSSSLKPMNRNRTPRVSCEPRSGADPAPDLVKASGEPAFHPAYTVTATIARLGCLKQPRGHALHDAYHVLVLLSASSNPRECLFPS